MTRILLFITTTQEHCGAGRWRFRFKTAVFESVDQDNQNQLTVSMHYMYRVLKPNIPAIYGFLYRTRIQMVSGQRLEWTKVRTGENIHRATNFNKIKNQCEHPCEGSIQ